MSKLAKAAAPLLLALLCGAQAYAATPSDAEQAIARASASVEEASSLKNQWTTTTQALTDAKKAAAAGDAEKAIDLASKAEALAKASIAQSKSEGQAWKDAVIK